jgi:penicillin-binding protein 1C
MLILDRETNALKVMIGGDKSGKGGQVNATTAVNQVGSTLKPFLYLLAFQNLGRTPQDTVLDLPIQYTTELGYAYNPKNFSLEYRGEVSIAEALAGSLNVPAVRTLDTLGIQNFLNFLHLLGIESLTQSADYYGLALALGAGEISLYELTRAYSVLAH